jgi:hypothetical protein
MRLPSLLVSPGPTAITVASGRVPEVAEVGKKRPEAVFCSTVRRQQDASKELKGRTDCFWLEALNKDTVKERKHAFDRFERGSLRNTTSKACYDVERRLRTILCL